MDEILFLKQMREWNMKPRDATVPTSAAIILYGQLEKTKVIRKEHEHLIYACVKDLEVSDTLYKKLTQEMKYDDVQVLKFVQDTYEQYLKDIRKRILSLQKLWSKNWCQFRATQVIHILKYEDLLPICDLAHDRLVPIELVLKVVFDIKSEYGDHRRKKSKAEVTIDPRVLKVYNEQKEFNSRTIVHKKLQKTQET